MAESEMDSCPVCSGAAKQKHEAANDRYEYVCRRCGAFSMSGSAEAMARSAPLDGLQGAIGAGWINDHPGIELTSEDIVFLHKAKMPSVAERAMKLLRAVSRATPSIGGSINLHFMGLRNNHLDDAWLPWMGVSYSVSGADVRYLIWDYLTNGLGYLLCDPDANMGTFALKNIRLSPAGFSALESLSSPASTDEMGFCAMWFNEEVKPLWTVAIEPAIEAAGYAALRIDGHQHNNKIDDEIIAALRRARFVVADFTGERGGVYFEAGFALGLGKQVIWMVRDNLIDKIHFDTRQYNFLMWSPDALVDARDRLKNRIEATVGRGARTQKVYT